MEKQEQDKYFASVPSNIRKLLEAHNETITSLARELGISRQAVAQYADGSAQPNAEKLMVIADHFGVSVDWILGRTEAPTRDADTQSVCDFTGLSVAVVESLKLSKERGEHIEALNLFLTEAQQRAFFIGIRTLAADESIMRYVRAVRKKEVPRKILDHDGFKEHEEAYAEYKATREQKLTKFQLVEDFMKILDSIVNELASRQDFQKLGALDGEKLLSGEDIYFDLSQDVLQGGE